MCGVAGFFSFSGPINEKNRSDLISISELISSRGPNHSGDWAHDNVIVAHRRLAILDLDDRSNQPFASQCGRYIMVYNGEIYNFKNLRNDLKEEGFCPRTISDTEVVIELFAREGVAAFKKLRGMFALAIWDLQNRSLTLSRDSYGIKPLFYSHDSKGIWFSSQAKSLILSGAVDKEIENAGVVSFLLSGSVAEPWTIYSGVFGVKGGCALTIDSSGEIVEECWDELSRYWSIDNGDLSGDEISTIVTSSIRDTVDRHLVSDVPVSLFLSSGVDSCVLASQMVQLGQQFTGITVAFSEFTGTINDESIFAQKLASKLGFKHHVRTFSREEFKADIPRILESMDLPTIDGINSWFASKATSETGFKVAISGVGGDELFCGYPSFSNIPRILALRDIATGIPFGPEILRKMLDYASIFTKNKKFKYLSGALNSVEDVFILQRGLFLVDELMKRLPGEVVTDGLRKLGESAIQIPSYKSYSRSVSYLESIKYLKNQLLRDSDWTSMAHSVELRTPFVDTHFLSKIAPHIESFTQGRGKSAMLNSMDQLFRTEMSNRKKTGFSTPMAKWLNSDFYKNEKSHFSKSIGENAPWAERWASVVLGHFIEDEF